jgi:hypothetical protein
MTNALPGRPVQNNAQRAVESFHTYLLLILGIAFVGAGIAILGFASGSLAAVGIGAGFLIADGIISLFIAVITKSSTTHLHKMQTTPDLNHWLKLNNPAAPEVRRQGCNQSPTDDQFPNARSLANDLAGRPRSPRYTAIIDKEKPWAGRPELKDGTLRVDATNAAGASRSISPRYQLFD